MVYKDLNLFLLLGFVFFGSSYFISLGNNYTIPKSEYNELRQDGKVWAYVRKDGKL